MNTTNTTGPSVKCAANIHPSLITCQPDHVIACGDPSFGSIVLRAGAAKVNVVADHEGTTRQTIASEGVGRVSSASSPWVNMGVNLRVSGRSATSLLVKVHSAPECQQGVGRVSTFRGASKGVMSMRGLLAV